MYKYTIAHSVVIIVCSASFSTWASDESAKIDAHIKNLKANVVVKKTLVDGSGKKISCVDIYNQPALNNPLLQGHQIQMQASPELRKILPNIKENDATSSCPTGSVSMQLPTNEDVARAGSLNKFLSKYGIDNSIDSTSISYSNIPKPSINGHEYAAYGQAVNAIAAQSTFNIWKPLVEANDMSLTQLWLAGGSGSATQTVEVGIQVLPSKYGDYLPHLFIYYTADNYNKSGCYNLDCSGFIKTSDILPIGGVIPSSVSGGTQVEGTLAFYRDPSTGNWILYYFDGTNYTQSGYYPKALFGKGQLSQYAQYVKFGGEIYSPTSTPHTTTDMGSGSFPSGGYKYTAYQRNLKYIDSQSAVHDFSKTVSYIDNTSCYNITTGTDTTWGSSIYFGGPGKSTSCP